MLGVCLLFYHLHLKANYKKLTEETKKLKHEVNILQDNLEETKAQNDNLNDALETLEAASVTEIKLLQDNLEEIKAENDNLNDALETLKAVTVTEVNMLQDSLEETEAPKYNPVDVSFLNTGIAAESCLEMKNTYGFTPCVHGQCLDQINDYVCKCENGWFGKNCDFKCPTESWLDWLWGLKGNFHI